MLRCPRCQGALVNEAEEVSCWNCGWVRYIGPIRETLVWERQVSPLRVVHGFLGSDRPLKGAE